MLLPAAMKSRITLAQLGLVSLLVLGACSDSHGRSDLDGGSREIDASHPADAGPSIDAGHDAGRDAGPLDAGPRATCDADRASAMICPGLLCDGPSLWYWSGDRCFSVDCGACEGEDCGHGASSEADCMAAHAECEPALCESSGGTWQWWAEECGHFVCGEPPPQDCIVGMPVCDCGPGRSFDPEHGCFDDTSCPEVDPLPPDALCTSTGGEWSAICCNTECGAYCPLACAAMACDCGPMRVFDAGRGCVTAARCYERHEGETCSGGARCDDGTICCMHCGGAGCVGEPTCQAPACGHGPDTDECGNCTTCP